MTTDTGITVVGVDHHGHGVPANHALDATLQLPVARISGLLIGANRVQVGRTDRVWNGYARIAQAIDQFFEEEINFVQALAAEQVLHNVL